MAEQNINASEGDRPKAAGNGIGCCILELPCCKPPGSRAGALAKIIRAAIGEEAKPSACIDAAEAILEHYDLVPSGVGKAISEGYWPMFQRAIGRRKDDLPMTTDTSPTEGA